MTENAPQTTPPDPPADPQQQQDPAPADPTPTRQPTHDEYKKVQAEAASRRRELREAEAERDTLRTRVETIDRQEVERIAGETLRDPRDLWLTAKLDDLRGEDGEVDREKVGVELARIAKAKPHWRIATPTPDLHGGVRAMPPEPPDSFGKRLKDSARR